MKNKIHTIQTIFFLSHVIFYYHLCCRGYIRLLSPCGGNNSQQLVTARQVGGLESATGGTATPRKSEHSLNQADV